MDQTATPGVADIPFAGRQDALFERHLVFDVLKEPLEAGERDRFEAAARAIRERPARNWIKTRLTHDRLNPKRVYYLSMEFLIGRSLANNVTNSGAAGFCRQRGTRGGTGLDRHRGSGARCRAGKWWPGALAACFLESMATLGIPAMGYGLRYEYRMFQAEIREWLATESRITGFAVPTRGKLVRWTISWK